MNKRLLLFDIVLAFSAAVQAADQPKRKPPLPPGTQIHRDLEYVAGGHARNKLDLYLPARADRPLPVIVWVHGGAWLAGSKEGCPAVPWTSSKPPNNTRRG